MRQPPPSILALLLAASLTASCGADDPSPGFGAEDAGADAATPVPDAGSKAGEDAGQRPAPRPDSGADSGGDADTGSATDADTGPEEDAGTASGESCADAIDVTAGGEWAGQTTVGAGDDLSAPPSSENCPSGAVSGPDRIYVVRPEAAASYEVTVTPTDEGYDPLLYVKASCDEAQACVAGTVLNGPGEAEAVSFSVEPGVPFFVIVDGELLSEGAFTLTVERL